MTTSKTTDFNYLHPNYNANSFFFINNFFFFKKKGANGHLILNKKN